MKTIISTLETPNLTEIRLNGNTTRQVDFAIQQLFKGNIVQIEDHSRISKCSQLLRTKIMERFMNEHKKLFSRLVVETISSKSITSTIYLKESND